MRLDSPRSPAVCCQAVDAPDQARGARPQGGELGAAGVERAEDLLSGDLCGP